MARLYLPLDYLNNMEKQVNDFSVGLLLWQIFIVILAIAVIYVITKLVRSILRYLNK